jgi:hypothetical protein
MLEVATTLRSRPPRLSEVGALLPTAGGEAMNGAVTPAPKVPPPSRPDFHSFQNPGNACANFTITMPIELTGVLLCKNAYARRYINIRTTLWRELTQKSGV